MSDQYFDTIKTKSIVGSPLTPSQDEKGDFIQPTQTTVEIAQIGRAEANSKGDKVPSQNGQSVLFGWMVYLPFDSYKFKYGQLVEIYGIDGELIGKGDVKRFKKSSMNCRLWV